MQQEKRIPIHIMGKSYPVPSTLTILKAMEYAGFQMTRGCGCRGGICGACGTVYRLPDDPKIEFGLACQTVVQPDMYLTLLPFFPANRSAYDLAAIEPTAATFQEHYPELFKCLACNTCTRSCPMDIEVMDYINAITRGDIKHAAELSFDCIMCGLCASRCPAEISHYNAAIMARRLNGRYLTPRASHLKKQVQQIAAGKFRDAMGSLKNLDEEQLKKLYLDRETEPAMASEDWQPQDHTYL
ncbi:MAG: 4Fe-4S dicluster domain-containing protein [Candidatus Eisenbacteria bacterium]|nr:4Fe-4S dicluster domain-containing protein [Candidatus Eisenbacteria bacterium]